MPASKAILDKKRNLLGERQAHRAGEVGRLAEVDEVFERECEGDGFAENNRDVLVGLVDACVLADVDGAVADVA